MRVSLVGLVTLAANDPFAAVSPRTPEMKTWAVDATGNPCGLAVVMTMGVASVTAEITNWLAEMALATAACTLCRNVAVCAAVTASAVCAADWPRRR